MEKLARPVIAGNWKMHKTISEARHLAADIVSQAASLSQASLILIPPFTAIQEVKKNGQRQPPPGRRSGSFLGGRRSFYRGNFCSPIKRSRLRRCYCWSLRAKTVFRRNR